MSTYEKEKEKCSSHKIKAKRKYANELPHPPYIYTHRAL